MNNDYNNYNDQNDRNNTDQGDNQSQNGQNGQYYGQQQSNGYYGQQQGQYYGQQQQGQFYSPPPMNGQFWGPSPNEMQGHAKARSSKTLGIIGLIVTIVCCAPAGIVLGIIALVNAASSRKLLNREESDAKTGKILGIVTIVLAAVTLIANIAFSITFMDEVMSEYEAFYDYYEYPYED